MEPSVFHFNLNPCDNNILNEFLNKNMNINLRLLETTKTNFDILEKFIYEVAKYHIIDLNKQEKLKDNNINDYYIEFWTKNKVFKNTQDSVTINNFHIDCDESLKNNDNIITSPLFSCVIYLDDSEFPVLLTDIDIESYKFKKFNNKNKLKLFFPQKNSQLIFDGSKYHGVLDIFNNINKDNKEFDRNIIVINLWKIKPLYIDFYKSDENYIYNSIDNIITISQEDIKKEIIYTDVEFSYEFYEFMLYRSSEFKLPDNIVNNIKDIYNNNNNYIEIISTTTKTENDEISNKKYRQKLIADINFINQLSDENINDKNIIYNRFLQRMIYNKFYTKEICEWIIERSENYALNNGGWTTQRHKNYPTTDIPVENIKNVFDFVLFSLKNLFEKIRKSYSLDSNIDFNISDLFIVKYDSETQNELEQHMDGSFLSFNILLSEPNSFEGGGTYFEDGITVHLEQGDVLVHSGRINHRGNKITKGTRYILVAFISIIFKCNIDDIM